MKKWKKLLYFTGLMWILIPVRVYATASQDVLGPLIQTMTQQDEYEGLLHLGFLDTKMLDQQDIQKAYVQIQPAVVGIYAENYHGSGVIYQMEDERLIIASCKHLLRYDETPEITFIDGFSMEGKLIYLSDQADLGFVMLESREIPIDTIKEIKKVSINEQAYTELKKDSLIFHVGSVAKTAGSMYEGVILDTWKFFPEFNTFMIHSKCLGEPGMSGGGSFDAKGNYIGMILGGKGEETVSLPLKIIIEEWSTTQALEK